MNKLYDRIDFENNNTPALNETNLNLMSKAIDDIDTRVVDISGTLMETVPEILEVYEDIEGLADHPPIIGQNGNWWTWDTSIDDYADSGVDAGVSVNVGTTTTLPAGSSATVTNSGTDTDPILNFGIPQGAAGQNGQDGQDGTDGVSPEVTITQITGGHTVTITDADHPTGQSFDVMDGADGVGVPSGGTTGQVLKKVSGTDYDTEWANESGGSSHTIINSSGTSMTQRTGLQFEGMGVTDDSTNDKTVVTLPTPDYVDEQFNSSKTYSKGMTCISGNKRYRYINSTASSGHQPPNATYWEELSVASQLGEGWEIYKEGEVQIGTYLGVPLYRKVLKTNVTPTQVGETWNYDVEGISLSIAHLISLDGTVEDGNTASLNTLTLSTMNIALAYFDNNSPSAGVGKFTIRTTFGGASYVMSSLTAVYTKDNWS